MGMTEWFAIAFTIGMFVYVLWAMRVADSVARTERVVCSVCSGNHHESWHSYMTDYSRIQGVNRYEG